MKAQILTIVTIGAILLIGGLFIMNNQTSKPTAKAIMLAYMKAHNGSWVPYSNEYVESLGIKTN